MGDDDDRSGADEQPPPAQSVAENAVRSSKRAGEQRHAFSADGLARFCGLDLAWSGRNASGVAVVDSGGRLLESGTATADDAIAAWLAPHLEHLAVVAIDAPLVVPNLTGARPAERELTRAFGGVGAGAYPSNRGNPLFDPPRGETLADRFGWRITTDRTVSTACIEVYPHPAMVELFALDRVIPYKARPTRTVATRRDALGVVMAHLEALPSLAAAENARWRALRDALAAVVRPVDLKRIEDEVDGVLCAHLAWLWGTGSTALRVWGDDVAGFVVAPPRRAV